MDETTSIELRAFKFWWTIRTVVGFGDIRMCVWIDDVTNQTVVSVKCIFRVQGNPYAIEVSISGDELSQMRDRDVYWRATGEGERIKLQMKDKKIGALAI